MRWPFSQTSPEVGVSKPAIIRRMVVLPHPDGPSSEKNAPRGISRERSATARCVAKSFDKRRSESTVSEGIPPSLGCDSELGADTLAYPQHAHANAGGADALILRNFFGGVAFQAFLQQRPVALRAQVQYAAHLDLILERHGVGRVDSVQRKHGRRPEACTKQIARDR